MEFLLILCLQMYEKKMRKPICSVMNCRFIKPIIAIFLGSSVFWSDKFCHLRLGFWGNVTRRKGEDERLLKQSNVVIKNLYAIPPSLFVPSALAWHCVYLHPLRDSVCLLYKTFSLSLHISEEPQFIPMSFIFVNYFRAVQKQYMLFWLLKDAQLACKRCPLSPLLTPFWSPIKHLFSCYFITNWFPVGCRLASYMCFCC